MFAVAVVLVVGGVGWRILPDDPVADRQVTIHGGVPTIREYRVEAEEAQRALRGLWLFEDLEEPSEYRRRQRT